MAMGARLMAKIKEKNPDRLVSDCLSCRIQFNQALPYSVYHPVEILREAYGAAAPHHPLAETTGR
jgi:glycerol-3-phosphate dehydrogenase subunit C